MTAIVRHANYYGISCVYLVLALWVLVFAALATAESHTETYVTYVTVIRRVSVCGERRRRQLGQGSPGPLGPPPSSTGQIGPPSQPGPQGPTGATVPTDPWDPQKCENETAIESRTETRCQSGWTPYPSCSTDVDECTQGTSECDQICNNTVGSYTCSCRAGYRLASLVSCTDIDECTEGRSGCSQICSNTIGSYTCSCNTSYSLAADERSCNDIDECTAQLDNCSLLENFTCENTIGGYQCVCKTGFKQVGPQECRGESPEFKGPSGSNRVSESTVTLIIVVTVCCVVGVVLIIIPIACIVICAKKRKRNKAPAEKKSCNAQLPAKNVCDDVTMKSTSSSSESSKQVNEYESLTVTTAPVYEHMTTATNSTASESSPAEKKSCNAQLPAKNVCDDVTMTSTSLSSESSKQVNEYESLTVTTAPVYEHMTTATNSTASESCSGKADSKDPATGQSTLVNTNKGAKQLFKSKKADIDCKDGNATNESLYEDLAAVTEMKHIYEAIKRPSEAIHISVQGDASNDSSQR